MAWSGLARYFAGLYQLNVKMPRYLPSGRHLIQAVAGGQSSQAEVWLAGGEPVWRTVGVAAAGSGGGTISGAGLELSIPPGALNENIELSIMTIPDAAPSGRVVTGVWKVAGLPLELSAPVTLRLPVTGAPAGESVIFLKSDSEPDTGLTALPARLRDGYLEATLPMAPAASPGALESKRRESLIIPKHFTATIWGISGFRRLKSPAGKFVVSVLAGRDEDLEAADITGRILEEALGKLKALGIETDTLRTTPIDVFLFDFSSVAGRINVLDSETAGRRTAKFGGGPTWACR